MKESMCGINGFNWKDKKLAKSMSDSLKHRGPDGEGYLTDNNVSLGHRRLSIIDTSEKGNQPMKFSHKGNEATIIYNGEIYNFREIRKELKNKGYKFNSNTDTEVVLASYLEYGENCVNGFNGMWAFAIYDKKRKKLFLSRDRTGQKPLFYYFDGENFAFSSEIKGILKFNPKPEIEKKAANFYFSLGFIPAPYSIYKNIFKLEPRQNLHFDLNKKKIEKNYYYDWPNYKPTKHKKKLIEEAKERIKNSVKKRLVSDVPLGAFLSGGLDSTTIVSYMKEQMNKPLHTYSIGFEGGFDESEYINIAKDYYKTKHHHNYFREKDFHKILEKIFYYYDEPFADPSMFPTLFLSKFARKGLTVSLSGDGGDEVFGGYPRHIMARQIEILRKLPKWSRKILMKIVPSHKVKEGIKISLLPKEKFYSEARGWIPKPKEVKEKLESILKKCLEKSNGNLPEAVRLMDVYFYTLPDNFLQKVDRASMSQGLEVRSPFLDHKLIEFSNKIPSSQKVSFSNDKILFKEIVKDILPKKLLNRKKQGFTPPLNKWIKEESYKEELHEALENLHEKEVLSKEWKNFYLKHAFKKDDVVHNNYKIRLFLFYKWYKYWFKG
ncbi:MAG: asparagine synthase (glutamine-hydrolyzing) [Candidatus Paceibacteria bacterium]